LNEILLGTKNLHKIEEIQAILSPESLRLKTLLDFPGIGEAVEDGKSYEENAGIKALFYASHTHLPSLADDSGLEIDFLEGKPGIHSARFIDPSLSFRERSEKILQMMQNVEGAARAAHFACTVALVTPGHRPEFFRGELHGLIASEIRGIHGFGYDPIFFIPDYGKNLAEIEPSIKNRISHRARALMAAREALLRVHHS
jgi:XTP/dITP diphosphohydrolase